MSFSQFKFSTKGQIGPTRVGSWDPMVLFLADTVGCYNKVSVFAGDGELMCRREDCVPSSLSNESEL